MIGNNTGICYIYSKTCSNIGIALFLVVFYIFNMGPDLSCSLPRIFTIFTY